MTHSLTPHEQQQVDAAAKAEAALHFHPAYSYDQNWACQCTFRAGITFALDHLFAGRMEKFVEWVDSTAVRCGQHEWTIGAGSETKRYTTAELVEKYLQHLENLKQKEDGIK